MIVTDAERGDWVVDRLEVERAAPTAMRSLCRAPGAVRAGLATWVHVQIADLGGPARAAIAAGGSVDLDAILHLERVASFLAYADAHAASDCPFWLDQSEDFVGVHGDGGRFVIMAETRGGGHLLMGSSGVRLGGLGGGRALLGWGISSRLLFGLGGEIGVSGELVSGTGTTAVEGSFAGAVPVLLRITEVDWLFDVELAATALFRNGASIVPGVRAAFGVGLQTLRYGAFKPFGTLWLGYEFHPANGPYPEAHILGIGTRVGIDWDP
jgi:hypothetical protein